ncbi:SLATT domain-containing protein [Pseudomonas sp. MH2]|uniref:SLATT domain-containing protein n=1 Tax=Pseudomonas machongensis TaxID=3110229 RepID=A0ABU5VM01_9PSED|nr:SLATT domain-containing protein [Pseudomonas sp. MH2]MEA5673445.1 SLATT domain-containing protein [Pseudomonas sp. MH2]
MKLRDKVWFTYKARIQAHKRLEWLDFHSQLLLVWYALLGAALAVSTIKYPELLGKDTSVLSAILSIGLLGVSLAVANRDFKGRAIQMRRNYLELQRLYNSIPSNSSSAAPHQSQYDAILAECENHTETDDRVARVFSHGLTSRIPTWDEYLHVAFWLVRRWLFSIILYLTPAAVAIYAWKFS